MLWRKLQGATARGADETLGKCQKRGKEEQRVFFKIKIASATVTDLQRRTRELLARLHPPTHAPDLHDHSKVLAAQRPLSHHDAVGYDMAAALLEDKSDDFYDAIVQFRRANTQLCVAPESSYIGGFDRSLRRGQNGSNINNDEASNAGDARCQPAYTLDERLFPVPVDGTLHDRHGPDSTCAIDPLKQLVRVSLPIRPQQQHR